MSDNSFNIPIPPDPGEAILLANLLQALNQYRIAKQAGFQNASDEYKLRIDAIDLLYAA